MNRLRDGKTVRRIAGNCARPLLVPILLLMLALPAAPAQNSEKTPVRSANNSVRKIDVFTAQRGGYAVYRIPGLVVSAKGALLAYAEARKDGTSDWGSIDIVLRRSVDGGKSWSPQRVIAQVTGEIAKNPVAPTPRGGKAGGITYNNPIAIADRQSGVVHFVFCVEYMRAFYMRSDDDGLTFSRPVEITDAFNAFRDNYDWKVIATGPGHGIQLKNGRLLVPVWLSLSTGGNAHRPSVASTIYSDDAGATWHAGEIAVPNTEEWVNPSETTAVQLADGRVMLNLRSESKANRRLVTISADGASGWSKPRFQQDLQEPICFASMVRLSGAGDGRRNRLLFVNPDNLLQGAEEGKPGRGRDRKNLTAQLSYDEGETWTAKRTIEAGWSGYADISVGADGRIHVFYESGGIGDDHFRSAALTLATFSLEWLSEGGDRLERARK